MNQPTGSLRDYIKSRRTQLGLTQAQLAKAIGVASPDFISMVETGVRNFDPDRIPALAKALNTPADVMCWMALDEMFPTFADTLRSTRKNYQPFGNDTMRKLNRLPYTVQQHIKNLITTLYDQEEGVSRLGRLRAAS